MRIAWLIKDLAVNGGNRAACETSRHLNHLGVKSIVACPALSTLDWPRYAAEIVDAARLAEFAPTVCIRTYFTIPRPSVLPPSTKHVQYIQANYDRDNTSDDPRVEMMARYLAEPATTRIVVSHYLRRRLLARGIESHVAQPGLDHAQFGPRPRSDDSFRALVEGPLRKTKAVCESYGVIPPDIEVWGLGPVDHQLGAVRMVVLPEQEALSSTLAQCNVLVKLAKKEGHPLILLEAMACGCVPICSDEGGHLDFCIDGFNSVVCTSGAQATEAIYELRANPIRWLELSRNAIQTASVYSWSRTASRIMRILAQSEKTTLG